LGADQALSNRFWADFTLTPEGKKVLKLASGGDVIQWRPENAGDRNFSVVIVTVDTHPLKVHDVGDPQMKWRSQERRFRRKPEPGRRAECAANDSNGPGNKLSSRHIATFVVDEGAWKLQSIN